MKAITYTIALQEPLLATALQGDPNSSVSLPYIPGSTLRGILIAHYLKQHRVSDPTRDPTCRRLFFDGRTRYLHAYPCADNTRCLPTPRSLRRFKGKQMDEGDTEIFDASNEEWDVDEQREREKDDSLKAVDSAFCYFSSDGKQITFCQPERTLTIHTRRDPRKGRSHKEEGDIFRYEALTAGQHFQGVILLDTEDDEATICEVLEQAETCWPGRSRSAGYGRVKLSDVKVQSAWRETGGAVPSLSPGKYCTMTLLSDALLLGSHGQPVTAMGADGDRDRDSTVLKAVLGVTVQLDTAHTFTSSVLHGGFNRAWQLPLPQSYMLAAGSVIVFRPQAPLDAERVSHLEAQGIGARRAEGFGRVVFNWRNENEMEMTSGGKAILTGEQTTEEPPLSAVEQQMAKGMARRLLEADIERAILKYVKDSSIDNAPNPTQLNRMRTLARQNIARGEAGVREVREQFGQFKRAASRQFEQARISKRDNSKEPLDKWISNLLNKPQETIKRLLNMNSKPRTVAHEEAALEDMPDLAARTVLRLLAVVMERAVRQKQQKQGEDEQRRKEQTV